MQEKNLNLRITAADGVTSNFERYSDPTQLEQRNASIFALIYDLIRGVFDDHFDRTEISRIISEVPEKVRLLGIRDNLYYKNEWDIEVLFEHLQNRTLIDFLEEERDKMLEF